LLGSVAERAALAAGTNSLLAGLAAQQIHSRIEELALCCSTSHNLKAPAAVIMRKQSHVPMFTERA
jgi:hypothetical protein